MNSIERGLHFLAGAQNEAGWWLGFDTLAGPSNEWVSAYIGSMLAAIPHQLAQELAHRILDRLLSSRPADDGWGFHAEVPPDADTTSWVCRLAERLQVTHPQVEGGYTLLKQHIRTSGAVSTYIDPEPVRAFLKIKPSVPFAGWCGEHTSVTASVAGLDAFRGSPVLIQYLLSAQDEIGYWTAYWWKDRTYATMLAVEALASQPHPPPNALQRAVSWANSQIATTSNPFSLACAIGILVHASSKTEDLLSATHRLEAMQLHNGAWPGTAYLRIPPPFVTDPEAFEQWVLGGRASRGILPDKSRTFTTATVLRSLALSTTYLSSSC
ncbi:MAG: hypothetical protein GYB68_09950 [Chloroflexi bacterium]|nr:hypothetical protein [Chloroflexota bacterium]